MTKKKQITPSQISTNRTEIPIWQTLETIVNEVLHSVSITGKVGKVAITWCRWEEFVYQPLFLTYRHWFH